MAGVVVEIEEVADVVEVAAEVGWGVEMERKEEADFERADMEVVGWKEIEGSELLSLSEPLVDGAKAVKVEVKIEVKVEGGMMSAVRLAMTADRGSGSPATVAAAEEAAGEIMKIVGSALVRYANVRSVVSKHLTIVRTGQNLVQGINPDT